MWQVDQFTPTTTSAPARVKARRAAGVGTKTAGVEATRYRRADRKVPQVYGCSCGWFAQNGLLLGRLHKDVPDSVQTSVHVVAEHNKATQRDNERLAAVAAGVGRVHDDPHCLCGSTNVGEEQIEVLRRRASQVRLRELPARRGRALPRTNPATDEKRVAARPRVGGDGNLGNRHASPRGGQTRSGRGVALVRDVATLKTLRFCL